MLCRWGISTVKAVILLMTVMTVLFVITASYILTWNIRRPLFTSAPDRLSPMVVLTNTASTTDAAPGNNSMDTKPLMLTSPASTTDASPGNNPINIKLLVKMIKSKLEYAPRKVPDEKDLLKTNSHLFSVIPRHFLPDIKNPCWYEEYSESSSDPYRKNLFVLYDPAFRAVSYNMKRNFHQHLHHEDGKTFRLRCLPYFYSIGQEKCGTTDLYNRLILHPEIRFNTIKEPQWWARTRYGPDFKKNMRRIPVEDYLDTFDLAAQNIQKVISGDSSKDHPAPQFIAGDGSPSTLWDNKAWYNLHKDTNEPEPTYLPQDLIHAFQPNAKIIIILRDPVERLYSDYGHFLRQKLPAEDFHHKVVESIRLFQSCLSKNSLRTCAYNNSLVETLPVRLNAGFYYVYLRDWLTVFQREQILILKTEDYAADLKGTLKKVFDFLDVGPLSEREETAMITKSISNRKSLTHSNQGPMPPATRDLLKEFHQPFNQKLASLLDNKDFLWDND